MENNQKLEPIEEVTIEVLTRTTLFGEQFILSNEHMNYV